MIVAVIYLFLKKKPAFPASHHPKPYTFPASLAFFLKIPCFTATLDTLLYMRSSLPLIQKDYLSRMHHLTAYTNEGPLFARGSPSLLFMISFMLSIEFTSFKTIFLFSLSFIIPFFCPQFLTLLPQTKFSQSAHTRFLFINVFVSLYRMLSLFWWNWQTWWVVIVVVSLKTLLRSLTFLFGSMTVMLAVLLFWIYFVAYNSSLCFAESFPLLGNSHVVVSVSTSFPIISNDDIWALYYFVLIGID